MEIEAKESFIGLWGGTNPIPPWSCRHGKRSELSNPESMGDQDNIVYHGNISFKVFHRYGRHYN